MKKRQSLETEDLNQGLYAIKVKFGGLYVINKTSITVDTLIESAVIQTEGVLVLVCVPDNELALAYKKNDGFEYVRSRSKILEIWELENADEIPLIQRSS